MLIIRFVIRGQAHAALIQPSPKGLTGRETERDPLAPLQLIASAVLSASFSHDPHSETLLILQHVYDFAIV